MTPLGEEDAKETPGREPEEPGCLATLLAASGLRLHLPAAMNVISLIFLVPFR